MSRRNHQVLDMRRAGLVSAQQAAAILETTVGYVWRLSYLGLLKTIKIGTLNFYNRTEVEEYKRTHPNVGNQLPSK